MANQGYPYDNIASDRRFEELIYSIYKKKIENDNSWKLLYDDIALMQGVGEKGRDCVLYRNGVNTGGIQCKKYGSRISKPDCIKEILKFVLYSFIDNSILPDPANFSYYFVVSFGFSGPAADYLDKFNEEIIKEAELEKWFNELKGDYQASFKTLDFKTIFADLQKKLTLIKIRRIIPQDLDTELSKSYNREILPLFFEVRSVIDTKTLEEIKILIETKLPDEDQVNLSDNAIQQKFATASLQLSTYRDYLYNYPDSHISRIETSEILNWIQAPLQPKKSPILLLVGNPGFGKTVILKDVYDSLSLQNIPVIAIKSDRYYAKSVQELTEKLNLEYSPLSLLRKLKEKHETVIVIIDQIDSLSQSVTSRRDYIDTYNQLIHELKVIPGLRVVISIRTFDLNYDYEFSSYKGFHKVIVKPLDVTQLKPVLNKLGINIDKLSKGFIELLSVPNHLDIFCKIYNLSLSISQIHTIQDLYNELWQQKIINHPNQKGDDCKTVLYSISDKMYKGQVLSTPEKEIDEKLHTHLAYLISNGLITVQNKEIQFFHQSFYDYVLARSFVENKLSVIDYLKQQDQSIYIRPALKMILAFIRQKDNADYVKIVSSLLFTNNIRFHLQLLIINQIGFEQNPSPAEIELVKSKILKSLRYYLPFIESAVGEKWINTLIQEEILDQLLFPVSSIKEKIIANDHLHRIIKKIGLSRLINSSMYNKRKETYNNLWFLLLRRSLPEKRKEVLNYLSNLENFENKNYIILRLMLSLKIWDNPLAFSLFEQNAINVQKSWFEIFHLLEDAADANFEWSVVQLKRLFIDNSVDPNISGDLYDHQFSSFLEKIFKINPEKSFLFCTDIIKNLISESVAKIEIDTTVLHYDGVYDLYDFDRNHTNNGKEMMFQLVLDTAKSLAEQQSPAFSQLLEANINSNSLNILKIILTGLEAAPDKYTPKIFDLLKILYDKQGFDNGLKYYIRSLITNTYSLFTAGQKTELNRMLLQIKSRHEFHIYEENGKKKMKSFYGQVKFEYLSSIPEGEILANADLKKEYYELKRKFGKATNRRSQGFRAYQVGPPLDDKAYELMTLDQWENSFLKFDERYKEPFGSDRGGLMENYRKFEEKVEQKEEYFLPLIKKIIKEKKVAADYILSGLNGLIKAKYSPEEFLLLFKDVMQMPLKDFHTRQVVWMTDYLIKNKLIDEEILSYLCKIAIEDPNPSTSLNPGNPEFDTLNTNRGAAVHAIVKCFYNPEFGDKIFSTLQKVSEDPIISVRISALRDLAVLMNIDKQKTLNLFIAFVDNTQNSHVYKASINTAQYLARYDFEALKLYFENAIKIEKVQDDIAIILAIAWLNKKHGSYTLLKQAWANSKNAKANMVDVAINNYLSTKVEVKKKCRKLYTLFLSEDSKEIVHQYNTSFLHLSPPGFENYLSLIKKFSRSRVAKNDPHYFYEYLIKCCKSFPEQCIDLIAGYKKYREPNAVTGPYYKGNEPVKILVGAYNGLYEHIPLNKKYIDRLLNLFDDMLKRELFRTEAQDVLNTI